MAAGHIFRQGFPPRLVAVDRSGDKYGPPLLADSTELLEVLVPNPLLHGRFLFRDVLSALLLRRSPLHNRVDGPGPAIPQTPETVRESNVFFHPLEGKHELEVGEACLDGWVDG